MSIKVAILDDHLMVIKGIENMLEDSEHIHVLASYTHGKEMLKNMSTHYPDVLLLDINLPDSNGIELCTELTKKYPDIRVIALSNYSESGFIKNMIRAGAMSYLLKNTSEKELITAIKRVYKGEKYFPQNIRNILLNEGLGINASESFIPKLSRREKEILKLIYNEHTNHEIAEKLFISTKTVESHRKNLLQKLNVRNTAGLIKVAITKGLI